MDQAELDARIRAYYSRHFTEDERLTARSAQGRLERERVQELVTARIAPGARVLDVGGATGVHAAALAAAGHEVVLVDPVPEQVQAARRHGTFEALVGDARDLRLEDDSFDVALVLGPLYHLAAREERLQALREARRVVRGGGRVFAAVIPRFVRMVAMALADGIPHPCPADWISLLEHGDAPDWGRFPGGHFHTAAELEEELREAGLVEVGVWAVEGPDGLALEQLSDVDEDVHQAALRMVRTVGHLPGMADLSNHMMGIARVP